MLKEMGISKMGVRLAIRAAIDSRKIIIISQDLLIFFAAVRTKGSPQILTTEPPIALAEVTESESTDILTPLGQLDISPVLCVVPFNTSPVLILLQWICFLLRN